ncbi:MAG TPA: Xaa-Pro aminopeptidase, partial [Chloroflexi bacterium]|nr:Xaa-Pro aminopeptidase [Chloroflexota bacterium]
AAVEGNSEDDIAAATYSALIRAGSEYPGMPPMIAAGYRSGLAHTTWEGHKRIERGDVVLLEIPAAVQRYHAVFARSVVIGKPPARYREIERVIREAADAAIASIRPGITAAEADHAQRSVIVRAGYSDHFLHRTAYALGIAFPPHWDEGGIMSLKPGNNQVLEPNMVFHLISALYFYAEACFAITETIRVTENGCETITDFPRELIVH